MTGQCPGEHPYHPKTNSSLSLLFSNRAQYLMTAMWKSSSHRVFQLPCRNSRHHRNALRRVSTSTWSGRLSSLQCSSVSGWTCKAFSVTRRPSDMDGEEETPLMNLVFIFCFVVWLSKERGRETECSPRGTVTQEELSSLFFLGSPKKR